MKTPSDNLFKLIKSLDKYEVRSFYTLNSSIKNKKVVKLFYELSKQSCYDEEILKKDSAFATYFKQLKSNLYKKILILLTNNLILKEISLNCCSLLDELLRRDLHVLVIKELNKLELEEIKKEQFLNMLTIVSFKKKLLASRRLFYQNYFSLEEIILQEKEYNKLYTDYSFLEICYCKIRSILDGSIVITKANKIELNNMLKKINSKEIKTESIRLKFLILKIKVDCYYLLREEENQFRCNLKRVELLNIHQKVLTPVETLQVYSNYLISLNYKENLNEILRTKNLAEDFHKKLSNFERNDQVNHQFYSLLVNYLSSLFKKDIDKGISESVAYEKTISQAGSPINVMVLHSNLVYAYFLNKNYSNAISASLKVINLFNNNFRNDLVIFCIILSLLSRIELNQFDMVSYNIRFYKQISFINESEFLTFLLQSLEKINHKNEQDIFKQIECYLTKTDKSDKAIKIFNFKSWINYKLYAEDYKPYSYE